MIFLKPDEYQPQAEKIFRKLSVKIAEILPFAQIEHIGSSSIKYVLSKGDLDIYVGVASAEFSEAIQKIESLNFQIKRESLRTEALCPFESKRFSIDVGLQLVVKGSKFEFFLKFRDALNGDENLRKQYNQLKMFMMSTVIPL